MRFDITIDLPAASTLAPPYAAVSLLQRTAVVLHAIDSSQTRKSPRVFPTQSCMLGPAI